MVRHTTDNGVWYTNVVENPQPQGDDFLQKESFTFASGTLRYDTRFPDVGRGEAPEEFEPARFVKCRSKAAALARLTADLVAAEKAVVALRNLVAVAADESTKYEVFYDGEQY